MIGLRGIDMGLALVDMLDGGWFMQNQASAVKAVWDGVKPGVPSRCLEIGCSAGNALPYLEAIFDAVEAVDVDASKVRAASAVAGARTHVQQVEDFRDGRLRYPYPDGHFGMVVAFSLLHHLTRAEQSVVMSEAFRMLAPGGLAVFLEYGPLNPAARVVVAFGPDDRGSRFVWPRRSRRLMLEAGLVVTEVRHLLFVPGPLRALAPLERYLADIPFGAKYLVVGRKP